MRRILLFLLVLFTFTSCTNQTLQNIPPIVVDPIVTMEPDLPHPSASPEIDITIINPSPEPTNSPEPSPTPDVDAQVTPVPSADPVQPTSKPTVKPEATPKATPKPTAAPKPEKTAAPKPTPTPFQNAYLDSMQQELLHIVNNNRTVKLERSSKLETIAKERAKEVDRNQSATLGDPSKRLEELSFSYGFCHYGQILYPSYLPADIKISEIFANYSDTLTNEKFSHIGIGIYHTQKGISVAFIVSGTEKFTAKFLSEVEKGILELSNKERQAAGLPALKWSDTGRTIGRAKSKEMYDNDYFAHDSPYTGSIKEQFSTFGGLILGQNVSTIGENIAYAKGYKESELTAKYWVTQWMNSPGHKANILNPNYTHLGVGVYFGEDGRAYASQEFFAE